MDVEPAGDDYCGLHLLDLGDGGGLDGHGWQQGHSFKWPQVALRSLEVQLMGKWFQKNKSQLEGLTV